MPTVIKFEPNLEERLPVVMSKVYAINAGEYDVSPEGKNSQVTVKNEEVKYKPVAYISIEDNDIYAFLTLYPAVGHPSMTEDEIMEAVSEEGVRTNIDKEAVSKAAQKHAAGFVIEHMPVASGIEPHNGRDATVMIHFGKAEMRPKVSADGKVDYKNIDNIIHARKGDILITKRPATLGIRGLTVRNLELTPMPGKDVEVRLGDGVMLNPVGTQYISVRDGYVDFSNGVLSVHEVYYVEKDVDYSTGNITFSGTVHVKGDVLSGFKIEAKNDVIVEGICSDCEIIAHKSIYIKVGIKGNEKNLFMAKDRVEVGYAEKARIYAKNDIIVKKYAYNSEMYAGNVIDATSGEGIIAGGTLKAFEGLYAKQLGTQGNSRFNIFMGTKYYVDQALEKLRKEKATLTEMLKQIGDLLGKFNHSRPEVANNPKIKRLQDVRRNIEAMIGEMGDKEEELMENSRALKPKIKIRGTVYEGVTVAFFNCASTVREKIENAVFYLDDKYAEVAWVSLKEAKNFDLE